MATVDKEDILVQIDGSEQDQPEIPEGTDSESASFSRTSLEINLEGTTDWRVLNSSSTKQMKSQCLD